MYVKIKFLEVELLDLTYAYFKVFGTYYQISLQEILYFVKLVFHLHCQRSPISSKLENTGS